jgi:short-subunit dehydrogenase
MEANFLAIVNIISGLLPEFRSRGTGYIVGFGSVATIRGRSQNVVYSAAKRALAGYFESLQHQVSATGIRAQFYILGYIDTPRIAGKKLPFPKCPPARVADMVFSNLDCDLRTIYYPRFWRLIALILQNLPWAIYKKLPGTS